MKSFDDKVALVTGAASGIGRACALAYAREGAHLVLADIEEDGISALAAEIESLGRKALPIRCDVTKKADIARLAKQAVAKMGQVDLLHNNAGVMYLGPVKQMSLAEWEWIVNINLWGPVRLTHALLPHMTERRSGHIVTTASMAGLVGAPGLAAYSLTKFAMVGFSEALRVEMADDGIDVSVVCPAVVKSGITERGHYASAEGERTAKGRMVSGRAYPTEKAAQDIVRGIKRNAGHIILAPGARPLWALQRLSPELTYQVGRLLWRRFLKEGVS